MAIDDRANGSGWCLCGYKLMKGWKNESCVKCVLSVLIVLNGCVMDVHVNVGE